MGLVEEYNKIVISSGKGWGERARIRRDSESQKMAVEFKLILQ
jgi:hypothetical protein